MGMTDFETIAFRDALRDLLAWRRDVRRFRTEPVAEELLSDLMQAAAMAPSVGLSQPWRFIRLRSAPSRLAVRENFERCNVEALAGYSGEDAALYAQLKLAGLDEAPIQLAVFCDHVAAQGRGLGRRTMPEMLDYSVVIAIHTLWLYARAHGIGVGWVSILEPRELERTLETPDGWRFIAVLCIGYPAEETLTPALEQAGWEARSSSPDIHER